MPDISDKQRTFRVWLDKDVPGVDTIAHEFIVEAGEDADAEGRAQFDSLVADHIEGGWAETRTD